MKIPWTSASSLRLRMMRRTEAVVSEIIAIAEKELLVVGYWLVTSTEQIKDLLDLLIEKARSGVLVRFVFDSVKKSSGPDNFSALEQRWPPNLKGAKHEIYRWSERLATATSMSGHQYDRKLHAKVIVADRRDAFVTSANLTKAGLLENLEMGLWIQGPMAGALVRHFRRGNSGASGVMLKHQCFELNNLDTVEYVRQLFSFSNEIASRSHGTSPIGTLFVTILSFSDDVSR